MSKSKVWAIVDKSTGIVLNTIVWDGESDVGFGDDVELVPLETGQAVSIGYSYKDGIFSPPPLTDEQIKQKEQNVLQNNMSTKRSYMDRATLKISILQDAVDLEMATDEEVRLLPLWKKYRVLLNRIDANTSQQIKWPEEPK